MKYTVLILLSFLLTLSASAQKERKFIREGNNLFNGNKFEKSEVEYRKALDKKNSSFEAMFNLGDALYKQKKFDEALEMFNSIKEVEKDKNNLAHVFHNIGNTYLSQKKNDEAINAYKESLRLNPNSKETKYNLEWARHQKKQDKQKQNDKNKQQNKNNQDKNKGGKKDKNKKDQDKEKDKKDQDKNKDKKNSKSDKNREKQKKDGKNKISKSDAKRLLEALQNDEKKVQEKVKKAKAKAQKAKKIKVTKDW